MLVGKKNELTMRVLKKMRNQGAPKKVELISGMTESGEDLGPESEAEGQTVQSKSSLLSGNKKKKKSDPLEV